MLHEASNLIRNDCCNLRVSAGGLVVGEKDGWRAVARHLKGSEGDGSEGISSAPAGASGGPEWRTPIRSNPSVSANGCETRCSRASLEKYLSCGPSTTS